VGARSQKVKTKLIHAEFFLSVECCEGKSGNISLNRSFACLVAHGDRAEQFEFHLLTFNFHLQPVSRAVSERLNYSSVCARPFSLPGWHAI
jgi:hypothetical protein